jgi:hypothetical protein
LLHATYHTINQWILLSSTPLDTNHPNVDPIDNTSDPFWKLSFIFEALILFPPSTETTNAGYSNIVKQRLTQLRQGNIIALYEEAFDKEKYTPNPNKPPSFDNALEISHSAQVAADADNFGAANQRIQSCMPVVNITKDIFNALQLLYPQRTNFTCHQSETHYPEFAETPEPPKQTQQQPLHSQTPSWTETQPYEHLETSRKAQLPDHSHSAQTS